MKRSWLLDSGISHSESSFLMERGGGFPVWQFVYLSIHLSVHRNVNSKFELDRIILTNGFMTHHYFIWENTKFFLFQRKNVFLSPNEFQALFPNSNESWRRLNLKKFGSAMWVDVLCGRLEKGRGKNIKFVMGRNSRIIQFREHIYDPILLGITKMKIQTK